MIRIEKNRSPKKEPENPKDKLLAFVAMPFLAVPTMEMQIAMVAVLTAITVVMCIATLMFLFAMKKNNEEEEVEEEIEEEVEEEIEDAEEEDEEGSDEEDEGEEEIPEEIPEDENVEEPAEDEEREEEVPYEEEVALAEEEEGYEETPEEEEIIEEENLEEVVAEEAYEEAPEEEETVEEESLEEVAAEEAYEEAPEEEETVEEESLEEVAAEEAYEEAPEEEETVEEESLEEVAAEEAYEEAPEEEETVEEESLEEVAAEEAYEVMPEPQEFDEESSEATDEEAFDDSDKDRDFGFTLPFGWRRGVNKKEIADYLEEELKDKVCVNRRQNYTKTGLPLADTHYVVNSDGRKECFAYVYEKEDSKSLIVKVTDELIEKYSETTFHCVPSRFPKANEQWYKVTVDEDDEKGTEDMYDMLADVVNARFERHEAEIKAAAVTEEAANAETVEESDDIVGQEANVEINSDTPNSTRSADVIEEAAIAESE
jgi:predicted DNA-binding protein (MmcQ/YjbR family)